ncbi:hypothetical protein [Micromonospora pallida]|nr:hypothetical protein [Micromonospora pallida]
MLGALGLSPEAEAVYGLLVRRARAGVTELGDALRMPRPRWRRPCPT